MQAGPVSRVYERWWRPALGRVAKGVGGPGMADEKRIARLLMGLGPGDGVLDVACGPGNFTRDFARAVGDDGLVVGVDASRPMLERARARDAAAGVDNLCFVFARRGRAAVSRRVLRRRLLLRRAEPVRRPVRGARRDAPRAHPRRAHRAVHELPRPHAGRCARWRAPSPRPRASACSTGTSSSTRCASAGSTDVRQRISGLTQFVGGRLPA